MPIVDPFQEKEVAISDPFTDPVLDQNPEIKRKAIDALVYSSEMGMPPKVAYDAHEQIKKKLAEHNISFNDNPIYETQKKKPGTFLSAAPDRTLMEKIRDKFRRTPAISGAKAANVTALAEVYSISPVQAADEYEFLVRDVGLKGQPTGGELAAGVGETALHLGTGFFGMVGGGLASARALLSGEPGKSPEALKQVAEYLTFQPRTPVGQNISEAATAPFAAFTYMAPLAGDIVMEKTGSPTLGAATATAIESIPVLFMAVGPGRSAMLKIRKTNLWRKASIKERGLAVQSLEKTLERNPNLTEAEIVKKSERYFNEAMERRRAIKEAKAEEAVAAAEAIEAGAPPVKMPNVEMPDVQLSRVITQLKKAESIRKANNIPPIKNMVAAKTGLTNSLKRDTLLPETQKLRYIDAIRRVKKPEDMMAINEKIIDSLKIAGKRRDIQTIIKDKKLEKVENLRRALKFPAMRKMNAEELQKFETELEPFQREDVFLTQRVLETIDKTDIKGAKTFREVREKFAERAGIPVDMQGKIEVKPIDRLKYDAPLAKKNPFYRIMVEDYHKEMLIADAKHYQFEEVSNTLAKKARESRKRTLTEKLVPTDEIIFDYLSSPNKKSIAKQMTP